MAKLRKEASNSALQSEIREKRKMMKDHYYSQKGREINIASEARQVEKEFQLAKNFGMHKPSSKIDIPKEKLTKHFEKHFSERELELPPELQNPQKIEYLKDSHVVVNEDPLRLRKSKRLVKRSKTINDSVQMTSLRSLRWN